MRIFTFTYNQLAFTIILFFAFHSANAQNDTTKFFQRTAADTSTKKLNMDAVYSRPFLTSAKLPIAIGGYLEANSQFQQTDGINEGISFQFRRFTIFMSSTIARRIKFLSEIEFEDGAKEINIEFAALEIEFHPMLNLRGGIIMNPIGAFNQNHDSPLWDFIDRPLSTTTIIPATLSSAGFGLHGKHFWGNWVLGYEAYVTNGFDDRIISNEDNRTSLAAAKSNPERFEENNSGLPMFTGKLALRNRQVGEIGLSYLTGVYNKWKEDGLVLDNKRTASVVAIDFNTSLFNSRLNITGEASKVFVDVPSTYSQQYGTQQYGGFIDITTTLLQKKMFDWEKAKLNIGTRLEYVDYNVGKFAETNQNIADHVWAIVPALAFRPVGSTVIRFNYRYQRQTDLLGNPPALSGIIQFGFSSYF